MIKRFSSYSLLNRFQPKNKNDYSFLFLFPWLAGGYFTPVLLDGGTITVSSKNGSRRSSPPSVGLWRALTITLPFESLFPKLLPNQPMVGSFLLLMFTPPSTRESFSNKFLLSFYIIQIKLCQFRF